MGTDGVLLGAWTNINGRQSIADLGCGTGLISLMLAQRNLEANFTAIDISHEAVDITNKNFAQSRWSNRLKVKQADFNTLELDQKFDLIVSNPPYFRKSQKPTKETNKRSKHDTAFNLSNFSNTINAITQPNARVSIILPLEESQVFQQYLEHHDFKLIRRCEVQALASKPIERILTEFQKGRTAKQELIEEQLIIQNSNTRHDYTDDFIKLTKDYYLIL